MNFIKKQAYLYRFIFAGIIFSSFANLNIKGETRHDWLADQLIKLEEAVGPMVSKGLQTTKEAALRAGKAAKNCAKKGTGNVTKLGVHAAKGTVAGAKKLAIGTAFLGRDVVAGAAKLAGRGLVGTAKLAGRGLVGTAKFGGKTIVGTAKLPFRAGKWMLKSSPVNPWVVAPPLAYYAASRMSMAPGPYKAFAGLLVAAGARESYYRYVAIPQTVAAMRKLKIAQWNTKELPTAGSLTYKFPGKSPDQRMHEIVSGLRLDHGTDKDGKKLSKQQMLAKIDSELKKLKASLDYLDSFHWHYQTNMPFSGKKIIKIGGVRLAYDMLVKGRRGINNKTPHRWTFADDLAIKGLVAQLSQKSRLSCIAKRSHTLQSNQAIKEWVKWIDKEHRLKELRKIVATAWDGPVHHVQMDKPIEVHNVAAPGGPVVPAV